MTENQWWKTIKKLSPKNHRWLIFADWLEDNGDLRAEMVRTINKDKLRPLRYRDNYQFRDVDSPKAKLPSWLWYDLDLTHKEDRIAPDSDIEHHIFQHLTGWRFPAKRIVNSELYDYFCEYYSIEEAYKDLLNAYVKSLKEENK